jgi:Collagen triple helix repeat (20 copies)
MKRLIRITLLTLACLVATGFAAWASVGSFGGKGPYKKNGKLCVRYDQDDNPFCFSYGPRGKKGPRGRVGAQGPVGLVGSVGIKGIVGAVGPQGAQGIQGVIGPTGPVGPNGAFVAGTDHPNNTELVLGSKIGPIPFPTGPATGTELTPSVARCPSSGPDQEAYDGGATIITTNPNNTQSPVPPTNDVVGLESSFPGLYAGPTEVDPLPLGSTPGGLSEMSANAYEAQAVVTDMHSNDNLTVQAYVICGP